MADPFDLAGAARDSAARYASAILEADQLQRDLAAARADAVRYQAAVAEALRRGMEHAGFDRHMLAGEEPWVQEIAAKLTEPSQ